MFVKGVIDTSNPTKMTGQLLVNGASVVGGGSEMRMDIKTFIRLCSNRHLYRNRPRLTLKKKED
jgi:hypothetical protein